MGTLLYITIERFLFTIIFGFSGTCGSYFYIKNISQLHPYFFSMYTFNIFKTSPTASSRMGCSMKKCRNIVTGFNELDVNKFRSFYIML